ncbi:MGMT family protein [Streptomyces sp. PTY087I2]|uniref:MGMT family protein n=1 Tax=Streptomyces sp. PTY087I2 TaxID=1819298 RepID=UPI0008291BAC|nr:MGMT family protein [Streptomyces sp. PTY087I2]OCC08814.1 Methylated-DNA--protein-cysteine methyltransferase [Streptomyces sp. PTY087I2]
MNHDNEGVFPSSGDLGSRLAALGPRGATTPEDFALRVLRRAGISQSRYDTYVRLETAAGGLFVAFGPEAVTGAVLESRYGRERERLTPERFEESHRRRVGRSAIPTDKAPAGLRPALRTGRARQVPIDLSGLPAGERAVLEAVRSIPPGQLRPVTWIAREASLPLESGAKSVVGFLARNPVTVLIPCHRATDDNGAPCDAAYVHEVGDALRDAEGIDMVTVRQWAQGGDTLLGSDTTHIYCHPTCAHARRITPAHRVPFRTARDAHGAGYRACKSCRPVAV